MKSQRKRISPVLKWRLASKRGWKCGLCDDLLGDEAQVDHRIALSSGGTNSMWNLQVVHSRCHARKSFMETVARNRGEPPFCCYCEIYFSKYFLGKHIHPKEE